MTVIDERLAALDGIHLDRGGHGNFEQGHCAMEVVSWLAGQGFTDAPQCASKVLRRYTITLNDRWDDERRQLLKPYLVRMIGTGDDGKDELREQIAARFLMEKLLEPWFRLAGMDEQADEIAVVLGQPYADQRAALRRWSDVAWRLRSERWSALRKEVEAKVREHLAERPAAAAAAAAADADAVADAVAAAAAAAAADADAVAAAVAAAAAAADAAAAAVAVAVADADAVAGKPSWETTYSAAYRAARKYYDEHPLPVGQQIAELAASQRGLALELLDRLIDPAVAA